MANLEKNPPQGPNLPHAAGSPATEAGIQMAVVAWARQMAADGYPELWLLIHITNESQAPVQYRRKLRRLGLAPGVPDLFLPVARQGYHGLWLELKRERGRLSQEQRLWLDALSGQGYQAQAVYGYSAALQAIKHYLEISA